MSREWAEEGCHSGARSHADVPVTTASIGNPMALSRLSMCSFASDVSTMPNSLIRERNNSPTGRREDEHVPIVITAPR